MLVALQQIGCAILGARLHMRGRPPFLEYGLAFLGAAVIILAVFLVHALTLCWKERSDSPVARICDYFIDRRSQALIFGVGLILGWLQLVCLTWTKSLMPLMGPMWADVPIADFDARLLGADAWQVVNPILSPFSRFVDTLYALWALFLHLMLAAVLLAAPSRRKALTATSFFVTVLLIGVIGQFLLPSGGPIFWARLGQGHRFDALPSAPHTRMAADYLWAKYKGESLDFASGISAFPSMHVAMTSWMVFAVHALFPKLRPLAWAYFLLVVLGSIFLGWHYLADGLAGATGAIVCWFIASVLVDMPLQAWLGRVSPVRTRSQSTLAANFSSIHKQ
jgi:hypothetical protein